MAVSKYDKENLSQKDQDRIAEVTAKAERGEMTWAQAHDEAESIRSNAGYSGGRYGDDYNSSSSSSSSGGSSRDDNDYSPLSKGPGYVTGGYTNGVYGTPILGDNPYLNKTSYSNDTKFAVNARPDMSRRPDLAGKYATSNGYTVFYDDDGYAYKASKGVADYLPRKDINASNGTYNTAGAWTDIEMMGDKPGSDYYKIQDIRAALQRGEMTGDEASAAANAIRSKYGYTIDKNGNVYDSGVGSAVAARRNQWGIDTPLTDAQQTYLELMFPEQQTTDGNALLDALSALKNGASMQLPDLQDVYYSSSSPAPQWNGSDWDSVLESLANQLLNMNYTDWTKGDQYQALADRYGQQGKLSMQDVLGQISSRTGGLASSYATTAAQQQYNSFMSQLEDAAMEMYGVEMDDLYNRANMARQYAQDDYNKYLDEWNQWNTNRNFNYGAYRDSVADQQWQKQFDYNANRDSIADQQWQQSFDYNKYRDDVADSQWQKTFDYNASKQKNGSYGDGDGNGIGSDVYSWLARSGAKDYGTAYQMLRNNGYSTTDANRYAKYFSESYMADTKPVVDESSEGYESVLTDVQALRKAGESSATINNVIVQAQKKGLITSAQAAQLRGSYVGSR